MDVCVHMLVCVCICVCVRPFGCVNFCVCARVCNYVCLYNCVLCSFLSVCLQVWNHNLVVDSFMGQMVVPIPGDGDTRRTSER